MVRRSASSALGDLIDAMHTFDDEFVGIFTALMEDGQDAVRIEAVKSLMPILRVIKAGKFPDEEIKLDQLFKSLNIVQNNGDPKRPLSKGLWRIRY